MKGLRFLRVVGPLMIVFCLLAVVANAGEEQAARQGELPSRDPEPAAEPQASTGLLPTGTWRIEHVDSGGVGDNCSLAFDSNDRPHISYYDSANDDLKYAYKDGTGWHTETVDSAGFVGRHPSLALDSGDRPHISYCSCLNSFCDWCLDLKYARYDGSDWLFKWMDTDGAVGDYNSLTLVDGNAHISYYDITNTALKYVYEDDAGVPQSTTVDNSADVGQFSSLAFHGGRGHISYYDLTNKDLKYAYYDGSWHTQALDEGPYTGFYSSLDLCTTFTPGVPRIVYEADSQLKYAHKYFFIGSWSFAILDSDDTGVTSLALDSSCQVRVSHYDSDTQNLRFTYQSISDWHTETVDFGQSSGAWNSLALKSDGQPCVAYYEPGQGLSYACRVYAVHLPYVSKNP